MSSYFIWIMLIGMFLMMWFVSRRQRTMQEEQKRRTEKGLVPGNWVRTIGGFYGTVVEVDGDVVTLATPLGDESLWEKNAILGAEEPPFASAAQDGDAGDAQEDQDDVAGLIDGPADDEDADAQSGADEGADAESGADEGADAESGDADAVEEPPFGSASANDESGTDVEQADDDIRESEQDTAEPQS